MALDRHYTDPRLAALYDAENTGRDDTRFYLSLARDLGAARVVDLGCGTGVLARELAAQGHDVAGVDPAGAMLDVARRAPDADQVHWIHGTSSDLPAASFDLAVMTGHVAQVFLDDQEWRAVLADLCRALDQGGHLAFESRNPSVEDWRGWTREATFVRCAASEDHEGFDSWVVVTDVQPGQVALEGHTCFHATGEEVVATSTLRFRSLTELEQDLAAAGFHLRDTYGDWVGSPLEASSGELILVAERR